jgi:hypothetical protein
MFFQPSNRLTFQPNNLPTFKKRQGGFLEGEQGEQGEQGDIQMGIVPQLNASHLNKWGNVTLAVFQFALLATGDLFARIFFPPCPLPPAPLLLVQLLFQP